MFSLYYTSYCLYCTSMMCFIITPSLLSRLFCTCSRSKGSGMRRRISAAASPTVLSGEAPPLPLAWPTVKSKFSIIASILIGSFLSVVIYYLFLCPFS